MDFQPDTHIFFCKTGVDNGNKVVCHSQDELYNISAGGSNQLGVMEKTSFQRADGFFTVRVDHSDIPYYRLLLADTIVYRNDDTTGAFWIWCNIVSVDWKNPDCSFVRFKIDHFMTYQDKIDWGNTYAYIEREHIKNDWASDGGNPLFSNIGPNEDMHVVPDTPFYTWSKGYECDKVVILSPYGFDGKPNFEGRLRNHLYSSLSVKICDPDEANEFFKTIAESKDASINNIVGVYGLPSVWQTAINPIGGMTREETEDFIPVNEAIKDSSYPEFNNAKTLSGPFVTVKLYSSEGEVVEFNPQWFGSDRNEYKLHIKALGAGGLFGGLAAYFENSNGKLSWPVAQDFAVTNKELPSCPWTGDGFTDWQSVNALPTLVKVLSSTTRFFVNTIAGNAAPAQTALSMPDGGSTAAQEFFGARIAGNAMNNAANYAQTMASIAAQISQQRASGATLNGGKSFASLFDLGQEAWGFKVIYYAAQPYLLQSIDAFFDRFGYRVNRLKKLELENRPYWTFLKTSECHVVTSTGIPYISELAINAMFDHGVTMWTYEKYRNGCKPGDYSYAKQNKGIKGA